SPFALVSMFPPASLPLRAVLWLTWRRRRTAAVAVITGVNSGTSSGG
ncbi:hypothetical protein, partial [Escherichia coli]